MIHLVKKRPAPVQLTALEALTRRLPKGHQKQAQLDKEVGKWQAGYWGERSMGYFLSCLPDELSYWLYHSLRLRGGSRYFFQMDTLVLTTRYALILEVKNYAGDVHFDQRLGQFTRSTLAGTSEAFGHPLEQVRRQQLQLERWFSRNGWPPIPVVGLVVFSSSSTILQVTDAGNEFGQYVIRAESLPTRVKALNQSFPTNYVSISDISGLSSAFIKQHTPLPFDPLSKHKIPATDLLLGVHCPKCETLPMEREKNTGKWRCQICKHRAKDAHIRSLQDYALLLNGWITNREARRFLKIASDKATHRLLKGMRLQTRGASTSYSYNLNELIDGSSDER
ncbi:nuclease-related domain-containing protein [Shouchella shacheensis]|uniref:nuclease-related domain-containing protein n=1 Tax=Shouchella shacheensis TaxID=1649580 RepID=UPI00073FB38E|nr:nuclease-related domain-containing protein [Shouchella shacheensis]